MKAKTLKIRKPLIIVLALVIALSASLLALRSHRISKYRFTIEKWNAYEWNDKQLLIRDFLKQYDLREMSKPEIIAILGAEPDFYKDYSIRYKTENNLVYDFGAEIGGWFFTPSGNISLVIDFDGRGLVTNYRLVTYSW